MIVLKLLGGLFLGLLLYFGVTTLVLGTTMVMRETMLSWFKFDLYEGLKKLAEKLKVEPVKIENKSLEESDEEWLKNRGKY